jgi:biotin operon repressor
MAESNIKWKVQQLKKEGMTIEEIQSFAFKQMQQGGRADTIRFWQNVHNNVTIHYI